MRVEHGPFNAPYDWRGERGHNHGKRENAEHEGGMLTKRQHLARPELVQVSVTADEKLAIKRRAWHSESGGSGD